MKRLLLLLVVLFGLSVVPTQADAGPLRFAARVATAPVRFVRNRQPVRKAVRIATAPLRALRCRR